MTSPESASLDQKNSLIQPQIANSLYFLLAGLAMIILMKPVLLLTYF